MNNRVLLGSIAFGVSFGVSWLVGRDFGRAIATGFITLPGAYLAATVVNQRQQNQANSRFAHLKRQIHTLQQQRTDEYEAYTQMAAERERVSQSLNAMQLELRQMQLPGAGSLVQRGLSWDLSASPLANESTNGTDEYGDPIAIQMQESPRSQQEFSQFLYAAAATKRQIELNLQRLQTELDQLNTEVTDYQQSRSRLAQEVTELVHQKQQLLAEIKDHGTEVEQLKQCQTELEDLLASAEEKQQQIESGSHPLQVTLTQLQTQIVALHEELEELETQIEQRRQERQGLEQQTANLQTETFALENRLIEVEELEQQLIALQTQRTSLEDQIATLETQWVSLEERMQHKAELERRIATLQAQQVTLEQQLSEWDDLEQEVDRLQSQREALQASLMEKDALEQILVDLHAQKAALETSLSQQPSQEPSHPTALGTPPNRPTPKPVTVNAAIPRSPVKQVALANPSTESLENTPNADSEDPGLNTAPDRDTDSGAEPEAWDEFLDQLREYELEALQVIAHQKYPAAVVKQIAQDNLSTLEQLVAGMNELALDMVGSAVIDLNDGGQPTIAPPYRKTLQHWLRDYHNAP